MILPRVFVGNRTHTVHFNSGNNKISLKKSKSRGPPGWNLDSHISSLTCKYATHFSIYSTTAKSELSLIYVTSRFFFFETRGANANFFKICPCCHLKCKNSLLAIIIANLAPVERGRTRARHVAHSTRVGGVGGGGRKGGEHCGRLDERGRQRAGRLPCHRSTGVSRLPSAVPKRGKGIKKILPAAFRSAQAQQDIKKIPCMQRRSTTRY